MSDRRPRHVSVTTKAGERTAPIAWKTPRLGFVRIPTEMLGQWVPGLSVWDPATGKVAVAAVAPMIHDALLSLAMDCGDLHERLSVLEREREPGRDLRAALGGAPDAERPSESEPASPLPPKLTVLPKEPE